MHFTGAEGAARGGKKEYAYFISIARGSLAELNTQVKIGQMLGYANETPDVNKQMANVGKLLTGLYKKWNNDLIFSPYSLFPIPYSLFPNSDS